MATTRGANVIRITSTDTIPEAVNIQSIKYVANGGAGSILIQKSKDGVIGATLYEAAGSLDRVDEIKIRATVGIRVTIVAAAVCYIYTA